MVDYLRDEEEQAEILKEWWQKNGTSLIVTIVLAVAALLGWREWQGYQSEQAGEASSQYEAMVDALGQERPDKDTVATQADKLVADYPSTAYADYARFAQARLAVEQGDYPAAVDALEAVVNKPATDALEYTARLRLTRVLLQQQAYDKAAEQLDARFPSAFNGMALELQGDLAKARGESEQAESAYNDALDALDDGGEKDRVKMKLDDLKSAA